MIFNRDLFSNLFRAGVNPTVASWISGSKLLPDKEVKKKLTEYFLRKKNIFIRIGEFME